ncbi:alpha-glucosidase isoform X1 [Cephus cinctus]|uniref:alpha-glucosidase n=1 Tax=Cephus cinctus TaxID=211228 RepID=A0AAJ7CCQ9_CEPCN|nr:alpha-glucosidase isoform X1 [Cephus cinctus]
MVTSASRRLAVAIFAIIAGLVLQVDGEKQWWRTTTIYQIWPRSFKDSDGDGIGDLNGITSKLEHLNDMGIETLWISPIFKSPLVDSGYDVSDYLAIDPMYGTLEDFDNLVARAKELGIKVVLDYVPNHTSTEHEWFKLSEASVDPYTDYYMWHEGILDANGTRRPPNNWLSVFNSGSAWQWSDKRQAYYLHQFDVSQADLDFRNEVVIEETKKIITYWLDRGAAGLRIDALPFMYEDVELRDQPLSGRNVPPTDYFYRLPIYTKDLIEDYELVQIWRDHFDEYNAKANDGLERVIITEAVANASLMCLYYNYGSDIPFNFLFVTNSGIPVDAKTLSPAEIKNKIDQWLEYMPEGETPNWVLGNHDKNRMATRFGSEKIDMLNFIFLLLPGVMTVYNGDEIGMPNTYLTWEETEDPQACSTDPQRYQPYSRDPERTPFQWDDSTSAGFSTNTTVYLKVNENYRTLNLAAQKAADKSYYKNFQAAMRLRNTTVAKDGDLKTLVIGEHVFAMSRELDCHDPLLVVINWSKSPVTVSLDDFSNFSEKLQVLLSDVNNDLKVGDTVSRSSITLQGNAALVLTSSDITCSDYSDVSEVACLITSLKSFFNV